MVLAYAPLCTSPSFPWFDSLHARNYCMLVVCCFFKEIFSINVRQFGSMSDSLDHWSEGLDQWSDSLGQWSDSLDQWSDSLDQWSDSLDQW